VDVPAGANVLDVACGTANAAIRAAQTGGPAVGVDLTPELFDAGPPVR
jgi:ubiquinone/menaquinone biosynthesis C-methylase UbiE